MRSASYDFLFANLVKQLYSCGQCASAERGANVFVGGAHVHARVYDDVESSTEMRASS